MNIKMLSTEEFSNINSSSLIFLNGKDSGKQYVFYESICIVAELVSYKFCGNLFHIDHILLHDQIINW